MDLINLTSSPRVSTKSPERRPLATRRSTIAPDRPAHRQARASLEESPIEAPTIDTSTLDKREEADKGYSRANTFFTTAAIVYGTALIDTLLTGENTLRIDLKRYMGDPNP